MFILSLQALSILFMCSAIHYTFETLSFFLKIVWGREGCDLDYFLKYTWVNLLLLFSSVVITLGLDLLTDVLSSYS